MRWHDILRHLFSLFLEMVIQLAFRRSLKMMGITIGLLLIYVLIAQISLLTQYASSLRENNASLEQNRADFSPQPARTPYAYSLREGNASQEQNRTDFSPQPGAFLKGPTDEPTSDNLACPNPGFVVVSIFKDEAMNIGEWISHYRWQGSLHFYLIDNGSTDNWRAELGPGDLGEMTVITREEKHQQKEYYNSYLPGLREEHICDWALIVDIDEYLYPKPPEKNLASFFVSVSRSVDQVRIGWMLFGSSSFSLQPKSTRCSFVWCGGNATSSTKSAVRVSSVERFGIHVHIGKTKSELGHPFRTQLEKRLQLNHYPIQSREYFEKVKLTRGSASSIKYDSTRNWGYYNKYDKMGSKQQDFELCTMLDCCNQTTKGE